MSFTRVNVGGWAFGAIFTSAQANQLDTNVSNALDKSVAGDTLAGVIVFNGSTGQIQANQANAIVATAAQGIASTVASGIVPTVAFGIASPVADGISATTTAGITSSSAGGIVSRIAGGIQGGVAGGIRPGLAAGIDADVAGGITSAVAGGITSGVTGGLVLSGGTSDYVTFSTIRSRDLARMCIPYGGLRSGWTVATNTLNGPATAAEQVLELDVHNGSTLTNVAIFILPAPISSLTSFVFPQLSIQRVNVNSGLGTVAVLGTASASAGSVAAWNATTSWSVPCSANNVIDTAQYAYFMVLTDANGSAAVASNEYIGTVSTFANIANMQFQ